MSKTDEYFAMAQSAADQADASELSNVREQHERSAAVWRDLARTEQVRERRRAELILTAARRAEALTVSAEAGDDARDVAAEVPSERCAPI